MLSENSLLKLPRDIKIEKRNGKYLFLSPSIPAWVVTNANGYKALKLCDGRKDLGSIVKTLSASHPGKKEEIRLFFNEVSATTRIFSASPAAPCFTPHSLKTVHITLTDRCNLECAYCYAGEKKRGAKAGGLSCDDAMKIIDSANNISKGAQIVLTGGEPLLSDHALRVAQYAKANGNKTMLLTNGTLIGEDNAGIIASVFDLIKISLDGSSAEINDPLRGEGSYEKIIKAVELLGRNKAHILISMTVTRKNINDIGTMARRFGRRLTFAPLFRAGRARRDKSLYITGKEYYKALSSAKGVNPLSSLCTVFKKAQQDPAMKCAIGDAGISISGAGDVYPCHLLHFERFKAGNIREQSLEDIYHNSDVLKECRKLHVLNINKCRKCDIRYICGGACRARAFYEKNKINVSDDFCCYERSAYINGFFDLYELQ